MRLSREELVKSLSSVSPGLSANGIVEQSKCFVFANGYVTTFNEEIMCQMKTPIPKFTGAIEASSFLAILNKLQEDELELEFGEGELIFKGKRRKLGLGFEAEILLPYDTVEEVDDWKSIGDAFPEAVGLAKDCVSHDEQKFALTCVHVTPSYIEACDNYHMLRYQCETAVDDELLVRAESIRHIVDMGMSSMCETDAWIHFKNASGLRFSCRRWVEAYPDFPGFVEVKGEKIVLPGGLNEAIEKAEVFSSDNADTNVVKVSLREDMMKIEGCGIHGWYQEVKKVKYRGENVSFNVLPKLFSKLSSYSSECLVDSNRLVVNAGKFVYATCLELA